MQTPYDVLEKLLDYEHHGYLCGCFLCDYLFRELTMVEREQKHIEQNEQFDKISEDFTVDPGEFFANLKVKVPK